MAFDDRDREVEPRGDLLVPVAARDQLENLALARRQVVKLLVPVRGFPRCETRPLPTARSVTLHLGKFP